MSMPKLLVFSATLTQVKNTWVLTKCKKERDTRRLIAIPLLLKCVSDLSADKSIAMI